MKTLIQRIKRKAQVIIHNFHRYDYEETRDGWEKCLPVISEDFSCFDPYLLEDGNSLFIFYSERKNNSIMRIDSSFASNPNLVLSPIEGTWESVVNRGCVVKRGSVYYLWYTGQNNEQSSIGLAQSSDGINFKRMSNCPVMTATYEFEKMSLMNPCVLFDEKDNVFKMWYAAGDNYEPDVICYAESFDGINWKKMDKPVLIGGEYRFQKAKVGACDVHKTNDKYHMFFIGYQNMDVARICEATSKDGKKWVLYDKPLISPSKKNWDCDACYKPSYHYDSSSDLSYIFYNGRRKNHEVIGSAKKKGKYL